eukprot:9500989-Pyramimonas_sp.AAC.1
MPAAVSLPAAGGDDLIRHQLFGTWFRSVLLLVGDQGPADRRLDDRCRGRRRAAREVGRLRA